MDVVICTTARDRRRGAGAARALPACRSRAEQRTLPAWRRRVRSRRTSTGASWSTRYAARRAELRAVTRDRKREPEERFEATLALAELPRNSAKVRAAQPLRADRAAARLPSQVRPVAHRAARAGLGRADPGPGQGQLVGGAEREGRLRMTLSDPLGDMLTRIRNGQAAAQAGGQQPGVEAARQRPRSAAARGLHPRLSGARSVGHGELSIELKYHNGEPVIRELRRVSKPGRRIYSRGQGPAAGLQRPRHRHPVDAARRHVGRRGARGARRRRRSCARCSDHVAHRQASGPGPGRRRGRAGRPDRERVSGKLGAAAAAPAARGRGRAGRTAASRCGRAATTSARARCGACRARWSPTWSRACRRASPAGS